MTQIEKLYTQLVANRVFMRFRDFRRILEAFDFTLERISGSRHIFEHPAVSRALRIQPRKAQSSSSSAATDGGNGLDSNHPFCVAKGLP